MANDPQIQKEIKSIEQEFIVTEIDGIEFIYRKTMGVNLCIP